MNKVEVEMAQKKLAEFTEKLGKLSTKVTTSNNENQIALTCVLEAANSKEAQDVAKNYYPLSIFEITEYQLINKEVAPLLPDPRHRAGAVQPRSQKPRRRGREEPQKGSQQEGQRQQAQA